MLKLMVGTFPPGALAQGDQHVLARTIVGDDSRVAQEALLR